MKKFCGDDFLLDSEVACDLYETARVMPIFDFHCHLPPREIYEDRKFDSITQVWLGGDHYKWRALRTLGVDEELITGQASDWEKFEQWATAMPLLVGNPLYHWTHLELRRFFGIEKLLCPENAREIYDLCNQKLQTLTARKLIEGSNVKCLFTTDDPVDDLKYHDLIAQDASFKVKVLPAFRPDKAINIDLPAFPAYVASLAKVVGYPISSLADLKRALGERVEYFHARGCRASDHALDKMMYAPATDEEGDAILKKALGGAIPDELECRKFKGLVLHFLGTCYHRLGWAQEYHIGALRNVSARMFKVMGPDTGYDAINDHPVSADLAALMSSLDADNCLPRTIIFCLNPRDNEVLATIVTAFQSHGRGWIQFGSAWWFNDQKDGMERQMEALALNGVLATFIGMLTDSRSFLSYTRHEYFRRILCNKLGNLVVSGQYPDDRETLKRIVADICYNNAVNYFGIDL